MIEGAVLDHVALAVEHQTLVLDRYASELGGTFSGYGEAYGFSPLQLTYANGARIELLRPCLVEMNDFLARFLEQRGPGPHHLTFKVPDIERAIDECSRAGFPVINIDVSEDHWKEAFVHPKAAHGILVQLAQASGEMPGEPPSFFEPADAAPATLLRVEHAVRSLAGALDLFRDVLGGRAVAEGDDGGPWHELEWSPDGLHVRLWQPHDADAVVGQHPGRVVRLVFARPDGVVGQVDASENYGTELVFTERGTRPGDR